MVLYLFSIIILSDSFPTLSQETLIDIVCKSYASEKLAYQLPTSGFTKLLAFNILDSCLGYTINEGMV